MRALFLIFFLTLNTLWLLGQPQFDVQRLSKPKSYGPEIVKKVNRKEIYEQNSSPQPDKIFLKNGLRSSDYLNASDWLALKDTVIPERIDIVFSKYPIRESGYQMHYPLLCRRLKKLFAIDPYLNNRQLEWNIVLQTHCENDAQVDSLFHGVIIYFSASDTSDTVPDELASLDFLNDSLNFDYTPVSDKEDPVLKINNGEPQLLEDVTQLSYLPESIKEQLEGRSSIEKTEILLDYFEANINATDDDASAPLTEETQQQYDTLVKQFLHRFGGNPEESIGKVFDRNPQWKKALVVADWTGSMYRYGAQALEWHVLNFEKSGLQYFTLFNDGDKKTRKPIGKTEGIYFEEADNVDQLIHLYDYVMLKGGGGDGPENDLEAIIKGIEKYPDNKEVILIADNNACVRDMELLNFIQQPVHVVLCGYYKEFGINPQYVQIAQRTGGSLHTIDLDIKNLKARVNKRGQVKSLLDYDIKIGITPCFTGESSIYIPEGSGKMYTSLDTAMMEKHSVFALDLSHQNLKRFPGKTKRLKRLNTLNLSHNQIKKVPKNVYKLYQVNSLYLGHNLLTTLPYSMKQMLFLRRLDLQGNAIEHLPEFVFSYKYLEYLHLADNGLKELPRNIKSRKMYELYLNDNDLQSLPRSFGRMKRLEKLDLSNNALEELPKSVGSLKELKAIDLSNNQLTDLPYTFYRIYDPKFIILTGNPLSPATLMKVRKRWPNAVVEFQ